MVKGTAGERKAQDVDSLFTMALRGLSRPETLPQELGLLLLSAPRPTLSEYHVHVFSTRPFLFHIELAPLAMSAAFFSAASGMSEAHERVKSREKGRKSECTCKQMFYSTHRMSGKNVITRVFFQSAMKFPSMITHTFIFVPTPPFSRVILH